MIPAPITAISHRGGGVWASGSVAAMEGTRRR
jgi:hypothetical protein